MKKITLLLLLFISHSLIAADTPNVGDIAPDFKITQLDGSEFNLQDYKGKKSVYLVFWNTWCHFCMKKIPKLKEAQKNLDKDIQIIAVNTTNKDSLEESHEFKKRFNITYPLAFDFGKPVTDAYNVWGTPTEFIIDINGIIQHRDEIPDDLQLHLKQWNNKKFTFTQKVNGYFQIIASIVNGFKAAS